MRIPIYEFDKKTPLEVQEAIEDTRMLLNNGKYTPRVTTTEPTYVGEEGEMVVYNAGAVQYLFIYSSSGWHYSLLTAGPI